MGCLHNCCFRKSDEKINPLFVDVEKVLADAAWETYLVTHSRFHRIFIRRKDYTIDVPTGYYRFKQEEPTIKPPIKYGLLEETQHNLSENTDGARETVQERKVEIVGLEMNFNNDTNMEQKYNFKFQKERTSSFEVTCHAGFSMGGKLNFNLPILKHKAGISVRMDVSKTTRETYDEKTMTSATSEITLERQTHCTASVVMEEQTVMADFEIPMAMTLAENRSLVHIKRNKTGDIVSFQTFLKLTHYFDRLKTDCNVEINGNKVVFKIKGTVKGIVLAKHRIDLKQIKVKNKGENPTAEVPSTSSSSQDPVRILSLEDQISQVPPSTHASTIEGVQRAIAKRGTLSADVHCPGHV